MGFWSWLKRLFTRSTKTLEERMALATAMARPVIIFYLKNNTDDIPAVKKALQVAKEVIETLDDQSADFRKKISQKIQEVLTEELQDPLLATEIASLIDSVLIIALAQTDYEPIATEEQVKVWEDFFDSLLETVLLAEKSYSK